MDGDSHKSLVLETIADLRRSGYTVHAFCENCGYNAQVLLETVDGDIRITQMRENLVCGECGSRNMKIFQKIKPGGLH